MFIASDSATGLLAQWTTLQRVRYINLRNNNNNIIIIIEVMFNSIKIYVFI